MKRYHYIDALRGFGILSVVYCHLVGMRIHVEGFQSVAKPAIMLYFMPLFFFVSGFFAVKLGQLQGFKQLLPQIVKKAKALLLPTCVMMCLNIAFFASDFSEGLVKGIVDSYKAGYWFAYVLFVLMMIYAVNSILLRRLGRISGGRLIYSLPWRFTMCQDILMSFRRR